MNLKTSRLIHVEPADTIPVTCPHCGAALGTIDVHNLSQRRLWEQENEPLSIAQPSDPALAAEAGLIRGVCPACKAELASFWIAFRRDRGVDSTDEAPRLSLAVHGASFTAWVVIEGQKNGWDVVEHVFGPILDAHADEAFERLREILPDLPRPEAATSEAA